MHIFLTAPRVCRPESKMIFGKVFLATIKRISRNTGSPNQVEDAMKHIMKATNTEGQISQKNLCHFVRKNLKNLKINLKNPSKKSQKSYKSQRKSQNLKKS